MIDDSSTIIIGMLLVLFLLAIFSAEACQPNCSACIRDKCMACSQGYQLVVDGTCQPASIPYCALYQNQSFCKQCQPTYQINNGQCDSKDYSNCLQRVNNQCSRCLVGGLENGKCSLPSNCLQGSKQKCTKCAIDFNLQDGVCLDQSSSCVFNDFQSGVCKFCDQNFNLIGYQCVSTKISAPNCYLYTSQGRCRACKSGYRLNIQQQCVIPNNTICQQFDLKGDCLACSMSFLKLVNGVCVDSNCISGAAGQCSQCKQNFVLNSNLICQLNDPNCQRLIAQEINRCSRCKSGFFVNSQGRCQALPTNCAAADLINGNCIRCMIGFQIVSGLCQQALRILNCQVFDQRSGICSVCSSGFFLFQNTCKKVSSHCRTFDFTTGSCFDCKVGYFNSGGQCKDPNCDTVNPKDLDQCQSCKPSFQVDRTTGQCRFSDPNCIQLSSIACIKCRSGFFLDHIRCIQFPIFCQAVNNGRCSRCRSGFSIFNNQCLVPVANCFQYGYTVNSTYCQECAQGFFMAAGQCIALPVQDFNCIRFQNGACIQCARFFYFGQKQCQPVNPNCKDYNPQNGFCTDCYGGYSLRDGLCSASNDPNCKTYTNGRCVQCYTGFYIEQSIAVCRPSDPLCRQTDRNTGTCLSCFQGYRLNNGRCFVQNTDPNCIRFSQSMACLRCSSRYFMKDGMCSRINSLCRTFSQVTGACLSCYPGYFLAQDYCLVGSDPRKDSNCRHHNNQNQCIQCFSGYFLAANKQCQMINTLCRNINPSNGDCTACYQGYILQNGNCSIANSTNSDPNCVRFGRPGQCVSCFVGFFVKQGVCTKLNPLCHSHNLTNGHCLTCFPGYALDNRGGCQIPQTFTLAVIDPYCVSRNRASCIQCTWGYYIARQTGICTLIDPNCKQFNRRLGACLQCYRGYRQRNGKCEVQQDLSFPFCLLVTGSVCQRCFPGYYAQTPTKCTAVSVLCATHDPNKGNCLSCISGYFWQQGTCIYPSMGFDPSCIHYDTSAYCTQCKPGYYILNYLCTRIDPFCVNFDKNSGICSSCGGGRRAQGANCIL